MEAGEPAGAEIMNETPDNTSARITVQPVLMYCTDVCPYCRMADRLLASKGVTDINRIKVDREAGRREEMMARTGRYTVPQIFVGEHHVGGYDDLSALDRAGKLDALLQSGEL